VCARARAPLAAMSLEMEVSLDGTPSGDIVVCGSDESLGAWDVAKGTRLVRSQDDPTIWRGSIVLPTPESEFKLLMGEAGGSFEWEQMPNNSNRTFPARGVHNGYRLRMKFGAPRIEIQASAEHIEANARATRKLDDRQGSALQENLDRKGENAYYFAHSRSFEVPPDAKVISGPGLITGGAPVLIEAGHAIASEEDRTVWLKDYSWSDSTGKVKVYVPIAEGLLQGDNVDSLVQCEFDTTQLDLTINCKPRQRLKIEKLNGELTIEKCATRVEAHKNRIVLQLAKKRETTWYNLTKK